MKENGTEMHAVVCEVQRELFTLICEQGEVHAKLRGSFYKENSIFPVVGDKVLICVNQSGYSIIEKVFERKSKFSRTDFSGHLAGVGKSTLLNAIAGEELMRVSEIRENDSKGRHTTTHRQLMMHFQI
ncbi:GTPase RsgA [Anaerocolumna xylanovorans]|uniref:EngC GTPase domain-containing protein n=1 Tax=Anaerocolumna xylanovorans DSM 12503 TaxID=1121345 RepID=A0A1M7YG79_9FIRM|nr:GTPase RsgA [Anaerocolumna xylanovorans]SHO51613.1 Protein of unknown function, DUF258 [Anaerocolumna xylanovorans DSM 12503]